MSLSHDTMIELMAYADGELAGDDLARVEAILAKSAEARQVVEALGVPAIGAWLGVSSIGSSIGSAKADGIADAVMAKIEASSAAPTPKVSDMAAAREKRAARIRFAAALAAVAAVAAGVIAYIGTESPSPQRNRTAATVQETATVPSPVVLPAPVPSSNEEQNTLASAEAEGVEVNEVETPSRDVSVFYLPSTVGATANMNPTSVVVWLGDDNGGR